MYRATIGIIISFFFSTAVFADYSLNNPARIKMVVWRGCEDACSGFINFFKDRDLPVEVDVINADRDKSLLPEIRKQLIAEKPDMVVTWGTSVSVGILGTRAEFSDQSPLGSIPALFMIVADPIKSDIIESYESSGRLNISGVRNRVPEATQISLMNSYFKPKKIGIINDPSELNSQQNTNIILDLGRSEGFDVVSMDYKVNAENNPTPEQIPDLMRQLRSQGVDAVYVGSSSFNLKHRSAFTQAALDEGLPVFSAYAQMVTDAKGLMATANAYTNVGKLAGSQAQKVLFNALPAHEMPIASLNRFSVFINMDTAKQLDLYPPLQLISFAEIVKNK